MRCVGGSNREACGRKATAKWGAEVEEDAGLAHNGGGVWF